MKSKKLLRNIVASTLTMTMLLTNFGSEVFSFRAKNVAYAQERISDRYVSFDNQTCEFEQEGFTFTYSEVSTWNNYASVEVTITNNTSYDKSLWTLDMDYDGVIENIWNADAAVKEKPEPSEVNQYVIKAMPYNSTIVSGGSVTFGFTAYAENNKPGQPLYIGFAKEESYEETLEPSTPGDATEDKEIKGKPYKIPAIWKGLEYALFASQEGNEDFYVNQASITGSVHTNGNFLFQGNKLDIKGTLESAGGITLRTADVKDSQNISAKNDYAGQIEMPDLTVSLRKKTDESWVVKNENTNYGSDVVSIENNTLVEGSINFNATTFSGNGVMVAKDSISYNVGSATTINDSRMFLESENGNIDINGGNINMNAVLYAPNGTVTINANEFHLNGRIIAKNIKFNGTLIEIVAGEHDYDILYDLKLFEFEITKKYDTSEDFLSEASQFNGTHVDDEYKFIKDNKSEGLSLREKETKTETIAEDYSFGTVRVSEYFTGEKDENNNYSGNVSLKLVDHGSKLFSLNVKNGHAYAISEDYLPWYEAKAACEALGGHLVVINDQEENDYVRDLAKAEGRSYVSLGYTDDAHEGRWEWVDGSDDGFTSWNGGEPNDGLSFIGCQNFAYMYAGGYWDDGEGEYNHTYVCEWEKVEDISYSGCKKVIVTATVPKGIDFNEEVLKDEDSEYAVKKDKSGNSVITWKSDIGTMKNFVLPISMDMNKISGNDIPVLTDIHITHLKDGKIVRDSIPDIKVNSKTYNNSGSWEDVFDSESEGVKWTYFDMDALYVNNSNIELYAFASDDAEEIESAKASNNLKKIDFDSIYQDGKTEGLTGQYLYIKAILSSTSDGKNTPYIDSITVIGNTEKLVEAKETEVIYSNLSGADKSVVNSTDKYEYVGVSNRPFTGNVSWALDESALENAKSYAEGITFGSEGKHKLSVSLANGAYAEKEVSVSEAGEADEDYFDSEFVYPVFDIILDKTSYVEGETIKVITNIDKEDTAEVLYDNAKADVKLKDGAFEIKEVKAGEHIIKVSATNSVNNTFVREMKVFVYDRMPDVDTWFDKQTYFHGDNPILYIEEGNTIESCKLSNTKAEGIQISEDKSNVTFVKPKEGLHKIILEYKNSEDEKTNRLEIYMFINSTIVTDDFDDYKYDDDSDDETSTVSDAKLAAKRENIIKNAVKYIKSEEKNDGSFGDDKLINLTAETGKTLRMCGESTKTKSYILSKERGENVDILARKVIATGDTEILAALINYQNTDGGFGLTKEYGSDILDSLLVLEAVNVTGSLDYEDESWKLVNYIVNQINENGSYSLNKNSGDNVIITSMALTFVRQYMKARKISSDGTKAMLKRSYDYLCDKGYGNVENFRKSNLNEEDIYALTAISVYKNIDNNKELVEYLEKAQKNNGSFNDDIHTTNLIIELISNLKL